jgi:alkylation response protein AidB-like acyl-CoA dehydrogenase
MLWAALCSELDVMRLQAANHPADAVSSLEETALVLIEAGRCLAPVALWAAATGLAAVAQAPRTSERDDLIGALESGDQLAVTVFAQDATALISATGDSRLDGRCEHVAYAAVADWLVVPADTGEVYLVDAGAPGVTVVPRKSFDPTRPVGMVLLDAAPARSLCDAAAWARVVDVALVLLAAEAYGSALACLDLAVGHAKTREQFGRPIGSFQAIKHLCAELVVEVEMARAAVDFAVLQAATEGPELRVAARLAAAQAVEALVRCAGTSLQIHGGIGFTWDHDTHLYLRRAKANERLLGTPEQLRLAAADLLGV